MPNFRLIVLYVKDIAASTTFYRDLLGAGTGRSLAHIRHVPDAADHAWPVAE